MSFKANVNAAYDNTTIIGTDTNRFRENATAFVYNNSFEFKDSMKQANEYTYDANGNLTKDLNKNITGISYNCLNLPNTVTFSDGSTITYIYGADGTKLRTVHKIGSTTTTTDYCGNVIYENGVQKLLLTEEGYITLSDSKYHYYLKDHQGNNRVVISQSGTVEETSHYYPFGGVFASAGNVQPYKYNGKELDTKKGLNWYDYGARHYDAVLGRFITVDALYDKHFKVSPYVYCGNEPVGRIDPDGNDWRVQTHYNRETDKIEYKITVRAALINNSNNKELDIKTLAGQIVEQVNAAYTISGDDFVSTMDMQLRTVNSVDDIKDTEHVLQIVDQDMLTKTDKSVVMAETYKNSLDAVKILMVDDEERMRKLVKDFLTIKGYRVLEAGDGEQAIDIFFKEKDISLVILDVMMPKMDGWETCKTIRRYSQVPIIMLTARSEERDELLGFELGVDEYITKPFSPKILVARIEAILRRGSGTSTGEILEADGIRVDKDAHEVTVDGSYLED